MGDAIQERMLEEVAGLHGVPAGAYNIRSNGQSIERKSTGNIEIINKPDKSGIEIHIKPGTKKESVHIPVIMSQSGLEEVVYNDFYIGENADVTIIAGCGIHNGGDASTRHDGIHNCGDQDSEHDGIHRFFVGKNAKVKYVEKHYGSGDGSGERIMNPVTEISLDEDSFMEMETVQIRGVDSTKRENRAHLKAGAKLVVMERLMTHGKQKAESWFDVQLDGEDSSANIVSRSVARDESWQLFQSHISGNTRCSGHTECDAIIMENAKISAVPQLTANHVDAALIHEAAIGKIAGEQLIKLMTLGLTEAEAEEQIISGFLK